MEFKGTKGKWIARKESSRFVVGLYENSVIQHVDCWCAGIGGVSSDEEAEANAKLIAAAPDLLEALQYLKSHVNLVILPESVEDKINKAIEKALK